jgi:hypothetical protein
MISQKAAHLRGLLHFGVIIQISPEAGTDFGNLEQGFGIRLAMALGDYPAVDHLKQSASG